MAGLEQHQAGDTPAKQWEHIGQAELGSEMPTWHQSQALSLPPEPSFQSQAEVLGHRLSRLG